MSHRCQWGSEVFCDEEDVVRGFCVGMLDLFCGPPNYSPDALVENASPPSRATTRRAAAAARNCRGAALVFQALTGLRHVRISFLCNAMRA